MSSRGQMWRLNVREPADLARQLYKSENGRIEIPELDIEMDSSEEKTSTVGELVRDFRDSMLPLIGSALEGQAFLSQLDDLLSIKSPWVLLIDDPSALSWIGADATGCGSSVHVEDVAGLADRLPMSHVMARTAHAPTTEPPLLESCAAPCSLLRRLTGPLAHCGWP